MATARLALFSPRRFRLLVLLAAISYSPVAAFISSRCRWSSRAVPHHQGRAAAEAAEPSTAPLSVADEFKAAISKDGFVSAKAVVTSHLIRDITHSQGALPLAAAALGRAITCCLLMADGLKQVSRISS